jgi:glycerol-3-phosphate acyltransferase PlsX
MKIGFDIMGGDHAPANEIEGAILASATLPPSVKIILIGDSDKAKAYLKSKNLDENTFEIVHTTEVIDMGEHPTKAFSQKPNSSIFLGFKLLREGLINAFASSGNTGAMLVGSMFTIKTTPGVIRPCITGVIPKEDGSFGLILDVGTNADCKPDVLYQFGILGSIYAKEVFKKVLLLGEE